MPLIPDMTSLGTIVQTSQQRSNRVNAGTPTIQEWEQEANSSYQELYGIITGSFGENYKIRLPTYSFVTDGNTDIYPLPSDFDKLIIAEWQQQPGNPQYNVTLQKINFPEKNKFTTPYSFPVYNGWVPFYDLVDNGLLLVPRSDSGQTIVLWYIPRCSYLSECGDISFNSIIATNTITIQSLGQPQAPTSTFASTGPNFPAPMNAQSSILQTATFTAISGASSGLNFQVGGTDIVTATNFVTVFNSSSNPMSGIFKASNQSGTTNVVSIQFINTLRPYTLQCVNYSSTFSFWPDDNWTNQVDGVNGWEEYIVADVCIKVMAKFGMDPQVFMAQKDRLLQRIRQETRNRDAGSPKTVVSKRFSGARSGGYW